MMTAVYAWPRLPEGAGPDGILFLEDQLGVGGGGFNEDPAVGK